MTQQVIASVAFEREGDREFSLWDNGSVEINDVTWEDTYDPLKSEFVRMDVAQARALRAWLNSPKISKVLDSK